MCCGCDPRRCRWRKRIRKELSNDALRTEVTSLSAAHEETGWNDKEYVNAGTEERANDAVANNNR